MIISRKTVSSSDGDDNEKTSRSVVTKTVERTGGSRTTTTTFRSCTKDGIEAALAKLDIDPKKFHSGGTSVTKTIVYTDSSGKKEVLEEKVETYGDPDKIDRGEQRAQYRSFSKDGGSDSAKNPRTFTEGSSSGLDFIKDFKTFSSSKTDAQKMGSCLGKDESENCTSKNDSLPNVDAASMKTGKFEDDCLGAHNDYRTKHGVPPLVLSKEICAYAKEWANHLAATDTFQHRGQDRKFGENIFMKWSSDPNHMITGREPVDSWYSEIKDHVFGMEPRSTKTGHFTQVIWKESTSMGVAWARSKSGKILVVANYDPAGNFRGKYVQNVPPPKK